MNQVMSYCTARLFSRALVPLALLRTREIEPGNDNDPPVAFPSLWR
ncbi:hypothetical protein [Microvirga lotononidis]|uniref:Uncharacterized protein n=1 Tax=Microvirga lotononidis TaxID=864069 RepID=I4YWI9_9HYPH|nr:hypothetical protein [Microvirga lotononidis]EIM28331.1 hypothetical protein MicloDRAFT_00049130 [Microvirga lotononidis]WQO27577.1 hypothetical protein U0023_00230 [Microvirga lotononidis]